VHFYTNPYKYYSPN